jgi:hypothetical protein
MYGKPGFGEKNVFPWEGAPDADALLVDQMIREDVDIRMLAWWMGQPSVRPRDVMNDEGHQKSEAWRHLLDFELDQTERQRADMLELFWNCMAECNAGVWFEGWESGWRRGRKVMSFQDVAQSVAMRMADEIAEAGGYPPPDLMNLVIEQLFISLYDKGATEELVERIREVDGLCPPDEARHLIREWRKGNLSEVPYFAPVPEPGKAAPRALIPGCECLWPVLGQRHQWPQIDVFEWLTGGEVRARAQAEGWDKEWTAELLEKHKGMVVDFSSLGLGGWSYDGYALNGLDCSTSLDVQALRNADLYQIAIRLDWGVDKMGLPAPYRTIYHGSCAAGKNGGVALSECDPNGTGKHTFMIFNREVRSTYTADFRGLAHQLNSHQVLEKQVTDGLVAGTLLRSGPPVLDTMDSSSDGLRPFARMAGDSRVAARGGVVQFLEVPDISAGSIRVAEMTRERVDQLMMRGENVDADAKRARRTGQIKRACLFYREMQLMLCQNAREDVRTLGTLMLGSVRGKSVNAEIHPEDLEGELDVQHKCDVAAYDLELAEKKMDMMAKALSFDRYGATDFNKLYRIMVGWVDSDIASAAITTLQVATDREKAETEVLISKIVTGNIMMDELEKDAGNPQLRMELIDQWMGLAENQQTMGMKPLVGEQMMKLREHYEFQLQQFENATTGRVRGTAPELKEAVPAQAPGGGREAALPVAA